MYTSDSAVGADLRSGGAASPEAPTSLRGQFELRARTPWGHGGRQPILGILRIGLEARARREGANDSGWPGLAVYRFSGPTRLRWTPTGHLSLCVVVGSPDARVTLGGRHLHDRFGLLVNDGFSGLHCDVVSASPTQPVLAMTLGLDRSLMSRTAAGLRRAAGPVRSDRRSTAPDPDHELIGTIVRLLDSLSDVDDRRMLAPLHLHELVYRLLQRDPRLQQRHMRSAAREKDPIAAVVEYVRTHLSEVLTVDTLAAHACLSPSAFSRSFRALTDQSPYQFVKAVRMERAQVLLTEGELDVTQIAGAVGYTSVSHFIREFRGRFGVTPGAARRSVPAQLSGPGMAMNSSWMLSGSRNTTVEYAMGSVSSTTPVCSIPSSSSHCVHATSSARSATPNDT